MAPQMMTRVGRFLCVIVPGIATISCTSPVQEPRQRAVNQATQPTRQLPKALPWIVVEEVNRMHEDNGPNRLYGDVLMAAIWEDGTVLRGLSTTVSAPYLLGTASSADLKYIRDMAKNIKDETADSCKRIGVDFPGLHMYIRTPREVVQAWGDGTVTDEEMPITLITSKLQSARLSDFRWIRLNGAMPAEWRVR